MKGAAVFGAFATLLSTGSAHAVDGESLAMTCSVSGVTHMCSYSYTSINFAEALVWASGELTVRGIFDGPGYHYDFNNSKTPFWAWTPSWLAHVQMPWVCAWSGASAAEGTHEAEGLAWSGESISFHVQFACDCNSEIP